MPLPDPSPADLATGPRADPTALPRSVRLVAWGNAALAGNVSLDEAVDRVVAADTMHRVRGLAEEPGTVGLSLALGRLRAEGVRGLCLVLPVPGDPAGLAGPPILNSSAIEAGEAVLTAGLPAYGLVPSAERLGSSGTAVWWTAYAAAAGGDGGQPTLADAERELAQAVRQATTVLAELDVARWDPVAVEVLRRLHDSGGDGLAPGYPPRAHRVLVQARRVGAIAALAGRTPGGALTSGQLARRADALGPLRRASRRAVAAACNAVLEPTR